MKKTIQPASSKKKPGIVQGKAGMPAGPVPNTIMTAAFVKNLATSIYVWGWPMVNIHNRLAFFKTIPQPVYGGGVLPAAPPNYACMLTDYVKPEERAVACPNQDVVYGIGALDLVVQINTP